MIPIRRIFSWRPVYRVEIPRDRLGRFWFIYLIPFAGSALLVMVVVLGLSQWLPWAFSIGVTDPVSLRFIAVIVFATAYLWQVRMLRRWFDSQHSGCVE